MKTLRVACFFVLALPTLAFAINKCVDSVGAITFTSAACPQSQSWENPPTTSIDQAKINHSAADNPSDIFMQPTNSNDLFKLQYKTISEMTEIWDIVNARANLLQSTEKWIQSKLTSLETTAKTKQEVAALQAEVRRNEQEDRRADAQFNGGVDGGDYDETVAAKNRLLQAQERARLEAQRALKNDPEIRAARTRLEAIGQLVDARLKDK